MTTRQAQIFPTNAPEEVANKSATTEGCKRKAQSKCLDRGGKRKTRKHVISNAELSAHATPQNAQTRAGRFLTATAEAGFFEIMCEAGFFKTFFLT